MERFFSLQEELVSLVHRRNARDRPGLVIEYFVRNMRCNPKAGNSRDAGPPQVVEAPPRHSRELIQQAFCSTEFLEGLGSRCYGGGLS